MAPGRQFSAGTESPTLALQLLHQGQEGKDRAETEGGGVGMGGGQFPRVKLAKSYSKENISAGGKKAVSHRGLNAYSYPRMYNYIQYSVCT